MNNEQKIINQCLKGEQSSFKALYNLYKDYCFTICVRYGVANHEVKDHMQIIFSQIFASLKNYDSEKSKFKTWLTRVTINQILLQKRKQKIQYEVLEEGTSQIVDLNTSALIESELDRETIYHILSKMPSKYISVFNLVIIDGFTHKEIANQLGITEGTSRVLLHRGREWAMDKLSFLKKRTETKNVKIG